MIMKSVLITKNAEILTIKKVNIIENNKNNWTTQNYLMISTCSIPPQ